jgi:hypothetical protein
METQNNYLKFLKDLKLFCDFEKTISIQDLAKKHELKYYAHVSKILINKGIVKKRNPRDSYAPYLWSTIEPNIHMAKELEKRLDEFGAIQKDEYRKKVKAKSPKTPTKNKELKEVEIIENTNRGGAREGSGRKSKQIENRLLDSITIKLLFGLIKINIKLNYK